MRGQWGKTSCFLYTKHDRRRDAGGPENALRGQKRRGVCAISSHTQWRNSERAGGFNVWKGSAARSFQTMNVVWSEQFCTGKACGYRFMDTCRGGASTAAISSDGRQPYRRCTMAADLPCRPWEAKGGALRRLRPATEPQLIVVSESGNPHGLTLVILLRQRTGAGWEHGKGAGRGIRRGKREEGSVGREMCVS